MNVEPIAVTLAVDRAYIRQLATALRSLSDSAAGAQYRVFVLHSDLDPDLRHRVEVSCGPLAIQWIEVPDDRLHDLNYPARLPRSSAYRLLIPELLPSELTRVVYLDADVMVRRPLTDLWNAELDAHVLAAVRDAYIPTVSFEVPWRALRVDPHTPYFNSGVMVMSLDGWRTHEISTRATELMQSMPLTNSDQTALNAVVAGAWQELAPTWNAQPQLFTGDHARAWAFMDVEAVEHAIADPAIVHFCHGDFARPWERGSSHPFALEWLQALDHTAWAGWRSPRHPLNGTRNRVRRALQALLGRS